MIKELVSHGLSVSIALLSLCWVGCGSTTDSHVAVYVRVANVQQASQNSGGLSAELQSIEIEFSRDGTVLTDTSCLTIAANAAERTSLPYDLAPGVNTTIIVNGYESADCSGTPGWQGESFGVAVIEGQEVPVPIYVTQRGQRLNPIRGSLPAPRAFSSATLLLNGRVLVAGGFTQGTITDNVVKLQAACDAVLYDPGTAMFSQSIPLAAGCRGLHRALTLSDGKILLVGGSGSATLDPSGIMRPLLLADAETLVSSAEVFDPATNSFESLGVFAALQRSDAAAVLDGTQVVVLGGRTNLIRSDEIVQSLPSGNWEVDSSAQLITARSGAQAVSLAPGVLVAGGNADNSPTLELLKSDTLAQLSPPNNAISAVAGHTLTPIGSTGATMAGGVFDNIGSGVSDVGFSITWTNNSPAVSQIQLTRPRAYHAAETLPDGTVLLAGGFTADFTATMDLEILDTTNATSAPITSNELLSIGPIGMASSQLLDGSILLVGGLDLAANGGVTLSGGAQLFSP